MSRNMFGRDIEICGADIHFIAEDAELAERESGLVSATDALQLEKM
ncbi:MAG: hypothetical protein QOH39_1257 [Verrucomicrobiota bacterium]|jgi:hypothetical protein